MRTHERRWISMLRTLSEVPRRIKSPQLYQLSYRPKLLRSLKKLSVVLLGKALIVPAVYPSAHRGCNLYDNSRAVPT